MGGLLTLERGEGPAYDPTSHLTPVEAPPRFGVPPTDAQVRWPVPSPDVILKVLGEEVFFIIFKIKCYRNYISTYIIITYNFVTETGFSSKKRRLILSLLL